MFSNSKAFREIISFLSYAVPVQHLTFNSKFIINNYNLFQDYAITCLRGTFFLAIGDFVTSRDMRRRVALWPPSLARPFRARATPNRAPTTITTPSAVRTAIRHRRRRTKSVPRIVIRRQKRLRCLRRRTRGSRRIAPRPCPLNPGRHTVHKPGRL